MSPQKIQDIIVQRPGSKIPQRVSARTPSAGLSRFTSEGGGRKFVPPPRLSQPGTSPGRKKTRVFVWGAVALAAVILVFALSTFFERATLTIVPKQQTASFDSIIVARKGPDQTGKNIIPFELMELSDSVVREVKATAHEQIDRRAPGTVVVYNNYNAESQRLVKNTPFECPTGKIYRIHESVVIPGQKVVEGKKVPGSVEAIVYADEPGVEYNTTATDFTIPGFKGTPRFPDFYARSKTDISGGFSGEVKTVGAEEFARVSSDLEKEAQVKLLARAQAEKPKSFVLFPDAVFVAFEESEQPDAGSGESVTITKNATLYGVIFEEQTLSGFIAEKLSYAEENAVILIKNLSELDFKIIDKGNFNPGEDAQFSFTLKGKPSLVWDFDAAKVQTALRGVPKNELAAVLVGFPSVTRAEVTFRPFWKRTFPVDAQDIIIKSVLEGEE